MKLIFAGTPAFATLTLQALLDSQHEMLAVYTQPDRPAGRGRQLRASPVKQLAEANIIPVFQPPSLKDEAAVNSLCDLQADLMVVVAYGLILPPGVLQIPTYGCLNVHASLLPRWRGAAPIQRAILAGDSITGVTVMQMDEGLDTGDMLCTAQVAIDNATTAEALHDELARLGAELLLTVVDSIDGGESPHAVRQDNAQVTYADKLSKAEAEINWALSAEGILRVVKAFNPWPVAYTRGFGKILRIWDAAIVEGENSAKPGELLAIDNNLPIIACGQGALRLLEVQPEGKKRMPATAYMNARKAELKPGVIFGQ